MKFNSLIEVADFFIKYFDPEATSDVRKDGYERPAALLLECLLYSPYPNDIQFMAFSVMVKNSGYETYLDIDGDVWVVLPQEKRLLPDRYNPYKRIA